jgi:signal transduction histidine kinase/integral membrane sensor domain MASE1
MRFWRFAKVRHVLRVALLALTYFALGRISLPLSILPGYASPIFPPTGVALAALLIWGYSLWPGIFLGSFFLNLSVSPVFAHWMPLGKAGLVSLTIGSGSSLEILIGAWLIRRYVETPLTLSRPGDVARLLALGGPIASVVASLIGVSTLVAANIISVSAFPFSLWNWWIGDTVGVLVFTPTLLAFFGTPESLWRKRQLSVALPLCLAYVVYIILLLQSTGWERKSVQSDFEAAAGDLSKNIQKNLDGYFNCLYALEGVLQVSHPLKGETFGLVARRWFSLYPGSYDFSWSPRILGKERAVFVKRMRAEGFTNYEIRDAGPEGAIVTAPERPEYFPTQYLEPHREGKNITGYDTNVEPNRHRAVERARDSGKPTTVGPVHLIQQGPHQTIAVVVFYPVYRGKPESIESRRRDLLGFLKVSFSLGDVMKVSGGPLGEERFGLSVDEDPQSPPLYTHSVGPSTSQHADFPAPYTTHLAFADRTLVLRVVPRQSYWRRQIEVGSWMMLGSGLILTGLLAAFLLTLSGANYTIKKELDEKREVSKRLRLSLEDLSRSNADLENFAYLASHDLKEPLRSITAHLQMIERSLGSDLPEGTEASLRYAVDGAKRMNSLIEDLLDYSKVGRKDSERKPVEVKSLIETAVHDLQSAITESGAEIEVGEMPTLRLVRSEGVCLFENLLGNAIKYRDRSRPPKIVIRAEREEEVWKLSVEDNGIGIPEEYSDRVFGLFQRLHGRNEYSGTGIGLAICKRIVESHHGRIWVKAAPGGGAKFLFTFPVS